MNDTPSRIPGLMHECMATFADTLTAGNPKVSEVDTSREGAIDLTHSVRLEWTMEDMVYEITATISLELNRPIIVVHASASGPKGKFGLDIGRIIDVTEANSRAWQIALPYLIEVAHRIAGIWDDDDFAGKTAYDTTTLDETFIRFDDEATFGEGLLILNGKMTPQESAPLEVVGSLSILMRAHHTDRIEEYLRGIPHTSVNVIHERPSGRMRLPLALGSEMVSQMFAEMMRSHGVTIPQELAALMPTPSEEVLKRIRSMRRRRRIRTAIEYYQLLTLYIIPTLIVLFLLSVPRAAVVGSALWLWIIIVLLLAGRMICNNLSLQASIEELLS